MTYVLATILTLLNAFFAFLVLLGLPGTWLICAATGIIAWWQWDRSQSPHDQMLSVGVLVTILVLAALGELFEFLAGVFGSSAVGGTKRGALGALVGTLVGGLLGTFFIPVPLVGSLIGACIGAAIGAWGTETYDGRPWRDTLRSGAGAGVGRLLGTLGKFVCGVIMFLLVTVAAFWP